MSWRETLPSSKVEHYILSGLSAISLIGFGFGLGLLFMLDKFQNGADYMQRAYTQGGLVDRVSINKGSK